MRPRTKLEQEAEAEGVEGQGAARYPEVHGLGITTTDQGEARGTRAKYCFYNYSWVCDLQI